MYNIELQIDVSVVQPRKLAVFNGEVSTFVHQENRFVVNADVYTFSLERGLEYLHNLEYIYYDNYGKIKVDQEKCVSACGLGEDVLVLAMKEFGAINSYLFDYTKN